MVDGGRTVSVNASTAGLDRPCMVIENRTEGRTIVVFPHCEYDSYHGFHLDKSKHSRVKSEAVSTGGSSLD